MSNEDDTYSTMFTALKHPIRRKILNILKQTPTTYTDIQTQLDIDNGLLNYHLENMRELIRKDENGKYRLSEFGEAAQSVTARVEAPVKREIKSVKFFGHRIGGMALALGLISILLLSNIYFVYTIQLQSTERTNVIGSSLIRTRGLIIDSVSALNTTIKRGELSGADLLTLYGNLLQASSQCDSLSRMDMEHAGNWTHMRDALNSLSGFTLQLSQQTSSEIALGDSSSASLSQLKLDSVASLRGDLVDMLKAFPDVWVVTSLNPNLHLDGKLLSTASDSSSKLIADVSYARLSFRLGEPITEEQAIRVLMNSPNTDHKIIAGGTPVRADLVYIELNRGSLPDSGAQFGQRSYVHSRIYFSSTHMNETRSYWFFDYEINSPVISLGGWSEGSGNYIVDAQTGELVYSVESIGGGISWSGPDVITTFKPSVDLWDSSTFPQPENFTKNALVIKPGQITPLVVKLSPPTYYDADLPVSVRVVSVSSGFGVSQNVTSSILRTGGSAFFLINVFTPVSYEPVSGSGPQMRDKVPYMDVEFTLLGSTSTFSIFFSEG